MITYVPIKNYIDPDAAHELMHHFFHAGCDRINALVAEMWAWDKLPEKFTVSGEAWDEMETAITVAAQAGRWWDVIEQGDAYVARVEKWCDGWRNQAARAKAAKP